MKMVSCRVWQITDLLTGPSSKVRKTGRLVMLVPETGKLNEKRS